MYNLKKFISETIYVSKLTRVNKEIKNCYFGFIIKPHCWAGHINNNFIF